MHVGAGALLLCKELAAHIGLVVAAWAAVEAELTKLLSSMLAGDNEVGVAMYLSLRNERTQREALEAAARTTLRGDWLLCFLAIQWLANTAYKARNDIAHSSWGWSEELPDALLLIPHSVGSRQMAAARKRSVVVKMGQNPAAMATFPLIQVYRAKDFNLISASCYTLCNHLFQFMFALQDKDDLRLQKLCSEPDLREVVDRFRKAQPSIAQGKTQ
jgi:hypothetical protein